MSNRETYEIPLHGCTPEPLMNYLKALGVLRLVSEQADPEARGAWRDGVFVLLSTLDENALVDFFVNQYCPTPIVSPWNGGSGFYEKWDVNKKVFKQREVVKTLQAIITSTHPRFMRYRDEILSVKKSLERQAQPINIEQNVSLIMDQEDKTEDKKKKELDDYLNSVALFKSENRVFCLSKSDKDSFLRSLRSEVLSDVAIQWLDAAVILLTGQKKKNRTEAPVLGTGGNDGNSDFSTMFAGTLLKLLPQSAGEPAERSKKYASSALFNLPTDGLHDIKVGQYDPGRAGGNNSTQGMYGVPSANPWGIILQMEGVLMLGGSASRKMRARDLTAAFPFSVSSSSVAGATEENEKSHDELWLPLWSNFIQNAELRLLLQEGRMEVGSKPAASGVDAARAISNLGIDRGVNSFCRYEFQERLGQSYLATPLGQFKVNVQEDVNLLQSIDPWMYHLRRFCDGEIPPRFKVALRKIDVAMFDYCRYGGKTRFAEILRALGRAERELAGAERFRGDKYIKPLGPLPSGWVEACNDGSTEFQLALALAGIYVPKQEGMEKKRLGGIRSNLEPVDERPYLKWSEGTRAVVWNSADLSTNMLNVLARRIMDGSRAGLKSLPIDSPRMTPKNAIASFIAGDVDDVKISELLWGLMLVKIKPREKSEERDNPQIETPFTPLPRNYALLKLLFLSRKLEIDNDENEIRLEPRIIPLLRTGRLGEACKIAMRRLRSSGVVPMPHRTGAQPNRDDAWDFTMDDKQVRRLAAALLFPISTNSAANLAGMLLRRETKSNDVENETSTSNTES